MDWPTVLISFGISFGGAVTVAYLGPRFQHLVWKKQKLREQRIAVAQQFSEISSDFRIATHWLSLDASKPEAAREGLSKLLEQDALLVLVRVLFTADGTMTSADNLRMRLNAAQLPLSVEEQKAL